jgi:hypothetical protein
MAGTATFAMNPPLPSPFRLLCGIVGLAGAAIGIARASWADIPLADVVKQCPVVVVGEIRRIETAPASDYAFDTALIRVERVLKSTGTNAVEKAGAELPLTMPSTTNKVRESTDILYRQGQRGVWLLQLRDGKYWANYPKNFQPLTEETKIAGLIREQSGGK